MGRRRIARLAGLLLIPAAVVIAVAALRSMRAPLRSPRPAASSPANHQLRAPASARRDPNLAQFVGDTRRIAARAIDDTAAARLDHALVALGRRFLGTPDQPPTTAPASERLQLDLSAYDDLRFVEQLLALVNSRRVRTKTEGVDRFSDHVRQLRYAGGRVEACRRLEHRSLWAAAAARRGYLVDLTPFLPGARLQSVRLAGLMHPQDPRRPADRALSTCPLPPGSPAQVSLASVPLDRLAAVLPSLRSGDLFVLVQRRPERHPGRIGLIERLDDAEQAPRAADTAGRSAPDPDPPQRPLPPEQWSARPTAARAGADGASEPTPARPGSDRIDRRPAAERVGALLVLPGRGVIRREDLLTLARDTPGTVGVSFLRAIPNGDGRPDR